MENFRSLELVRNIGGQVVSSFIILPFGKEKEYMYLLIY
jgi:hypothetical protein